MGDGKIVKIEMMCRVKLQEYNGEIRQDRQGRGINGEYGMYNKGNNMGVEDREINNDDEMAKWYSYAHSAEHLFPYVFVNIPPIMAILLFKCTNNQ